MTVVAYPEKKNHQALVDHLFFERKKGQIDIFTQESFTESRITKDMQKHGSSVSSGSIALFFYSGYLLTVFLGMFCLVFIMLVLERIAFFLTANSYLCAIFSMSIAQMITSLSVGIKPAITYYLTCIFAMVLIYTVQLISFHWQGKI